VLNRLFGRLWVYDRLGFPINTRSADMYLTQQTANETRIAAQAALWEKFIASVAQEGKLVGKVETLLMFTQT